MQWLRLRPPGEPIIHGVNASKTRSGLTRTWQMAVPAGTGRVVIDPPAGVGSLMLQEMLRRADVVLVPVTPSPIDIHATLQFVRDLVAGDTVVKFSVHIGVVANRVRRSTGQLESLRKFLGSVSIPFVTSLSDSENYIHAAEMGLGIHEMDERETGAEREQWGPLIRWLANPTQDVSYSEARPRLNVIAGQAAKG